MGDPYAVLDHAVKQLSSALTHLALRDMAAEAELLAQAGQFWPLADHVRDIHIIVNLTTRATSMGPDMEKEISLEGIKSTLLRLDSINPTVRMLLPIRDESFKDMCVRLSTYDSRNAIDKVTSQLNAFDYDPSKKAFGPRRRDSSRRGRGGKGKGGRGKEIRAATTGSRGTALGRSARVRDDTRSRSVRFQDRGTRAPAGRSARIAT